MRRTIAIALVVGSILAVTLSMLRLAAGAYSPLMGGEKHASEICKAHEGKLGQAAHTPCGVMVGTVCRKGSVNAERNDCIVPSLRGYEWAVGVGLGTLVLGLGLLVWPQGKRKKA